MMPALRLCIDPSASNSILRQLGCAQAPMGLVHAALNVSQASRATVYPGELTFTPDNWADPKVGLSSGAALHM